jgi:hypothetical protein
MFCSDFFRILLRLVLKYWGTQIEASEMYQCPQNLVQGIA